MTSTLPLTLVPCDSPTCRGECPLYRSCSTTTYGDDNGPYLVSPQSGPPPPSPLPGNSVKLDDGRTITITWHLSPTVRKCKRRVCADDIPSPPPPSLFWKFIDMFLQVPPQIFQRP